jgi:hypothetical protein
MGRSIGLPCLAEQFIFFGTWWKQRRDLARGLRE